MQSRRKVQGRRRSRKTGRVSPHHIRQRLLVQGNEQGRCCTQKKGQEMQRQEQCEQSHDSDRVEDDSISGNINQQKSRESPRTPTLGTVPSTWTRMRMRVAKLDTSWHRSDTEKHCTSPKIGTLCTTRNEPSTAKSSLHRNVHVCSSPSQQSKP